MNLDQKLQLWNVIGTWLAGIATFGAVMVSLRLARRSERIRLKGYCGLRVVVGGGMPRQDILSIVVTNVGTRATIVNNISIVTGRFPKKRYAILTVMKDVYSAGIPHPLADGQEAHWSIPIDEKRTWIKELCDGFIVTKDDVRTLRFRIHSNHGEVLTLRPEEPLRKAMQEVLNADRIAAIRG